MDRAHGIYYAHLSDMTAMPKNQLEVIAYHEVCPVTICKSQLPGAGRRAAISNAARFYRLC